MAVNMYSNLVNVMVMDVKVKVIVIDLIVRIMIIDKMVRGTWAKWFWRQRHERIENWELNVSHVAKVLTVHSDWVGHLVICLLFLKYCSCGHFNRDRNRSITSFANVICDAFINIVIRSFLCLSVHFKSSPQILRRYGSSFSSSASIQPRPVVFKFIFHQIFHNKWLHPIIYKFASRIYRKLPWVVVNRELKSTLAHHGWGNTSFLFFMKYSFPWGNTHHGCGNTDNHGRGSTYFLENNYCIWPMTRMTMEAMRWSLKIRKSWGSWNIWRLLKDVQVGAFPSLGRQYENNGFGFRWGILSSG